MKTVLSNAGEFPVEETWTHERVVTHKTIVTFIATNFLKNDDNFKRIRKRNKSCQLCKHKFTENVWMHLGFTDKGNKLMCDTCTNKAIKNGVKFHDENERRKSK